MAKGTINKNKIYHSIDSIDKDNSEKQPKSWKEPVDEYLTYLYDKKGKLEKKLREKRQKEEEAFEKRLSKYKLTSVEKYQNLIDIINDTTGKFSELDKQLAAKEAKKHHEDPAKKFDAAIKAINNLGNKITSGLDSYIQNYDSYLGAFNTRLQGSNKNYNSITKIVDKALGFNAYITQSKVLEKLNSYVQEGIAYNVEQRAFLGTVAEKVASTFDAANGTLLQLVKIQQADSTKARLGMEATLTQFLNSRYQDTSYLNNLSKAVSGSILGANSQLSRDGSIEFEYAVQKWLGSMSSVGVSDNTIQLLAQGINALGTGDITALNSNTALQNLLVMAANNSGLDYSSLLSGGMNATTTNKLLGGVVQYMQSIAGTQNQVVKSQYANLFGMTVSDLTSILNLSSKDLTAISNNMLDYSKAINETEYQISQLGKRTSVGEQIKNVFTNTIQSFAQEVSNNRALYGMYLFDQMFGKTLSGASTIEAAPFGVGTSIDVYKTALSGLVGIGTLTNFIAKLVSGSNFWNLSADDSAWGAEEHILGRGNGLTPTLAESNNGIGLSNGNMTYVANGDDSALYDSSIMSAMEKSKDVQAINGTPNSVDRSNEILESIDSNVIGIYNVLQSVLDINGNAIRVSTDSILNI